MRGGFFSLLWPEITNFIACSLRFGISFSIKWFLSPDMSFHLIFLYFYVFLLPICCGVWLGHRMTIDLFVSFRVDDSDYKIILIRHKSHIKFLFVGMLHQMWNLRYSRHLRITKYVNLEPFVFAINLDAVSSSNVFSVLVFVLRCNVLLF